MSALRGKRFPRVFTFRRIEGNRPIRNFLSAIEFFEKPCWDTTMAKTIALSALVQYCNQLLATEQFNDWPEAMNGLQVENHGSIRRIAATVDACLATVKMAVEARADLLLVHHGLFWGPRQAWTGKRYELMQLLVTHNLAVYSSHLPLDAHPRLGNNARLCAALGFPRPQLFFMEKDQFIGYKTRVNLSREQLGLKLRHLFGRDPLLIPGGPERCRRVGVVSGGAGDQLSLAASEGVDTFICGEGPHWTYAQAEELGLNVFYAGHYATETFGVKALAEHLARKFGLEWCFLDRPTGM
jgi:dinuclear metal center YbgI/SA1388 family protein